MAANNITSQQTATPTYVNLAALTGSGESTLFVDNVEGVLLGIEVRGGEYTIKDRRTGQPVTRPNSWISHWMTPTGEKLVSWPTYKDETTGQVLPWSRFDPSINLASCSANRTTLHFWKDERNFYHLEMVEEEVNINPLPLMQPQVQAAVPVTPAVIPWQNR